MVIRQTVTINCSAEKVYKTLLSADEFAKATGAPAEMAPDEGGAISCFGGQIVGRQIQLEPNKMIVQAWRVDAWPEGKYSIVKFELSETGPSTAVILEHAGYPEDASEHLESGWHKMYWDPLKAYLE